MLLWDALLRCGVQTMLDHRLCLFWKHAKGSAAATAPTDSSEPGKYSYPEGTNTKTSRLAPGHYLSSVQSLLVTVDLKSVKMGRRLLSKPKRGEAEDLDRRPGPAAPPGCPGNARTRPQPRLLSF